jgi:hypothetical protein
VLAGCVTKESCGANEDAAKTWPLVTPTVAAVLVSAAFAVVTLPPAPISRLPDTGAIVSVGPPLFVSEPRMADAVGALKTLPGPLTVM